MYKQIEKHRISQLNLVFPPFVDWLIHSFKSTEQLTSGWTVYFRHHGYDGKQDHWGLSLQEAHIFKLSNKLMNKTDHLSFEWVLSTKESKGEYNKAAGRGSSLRWELQEKQQCKEPRKMFQAEGTINAKSLKEETVWGTKRPLKQGGRRAQDKFRHLGKSPITQCLRGRSEKECEF